MPSRHRQDLPSSFEAASALYHHLRRIATSNTRLSAVNVEQYPLFAQRQAQRRQAMYMADWIKRLDAFLSLNEENILTQAGKISHDSAQSHAEEEYRIFHAGRQLEARAYDQVLLDTGKIASIRKSSLAKKE
jgi:hypothetical protein